MWVDYGGSLSTVYSDRGTPKHRWILEVQSTMTKGSQHVGRLYNISHANMACT